MKSLRCAAWMTSVVLSGLMGCNDLELAAEEDADLRRDFGMTTDTRNGGASDVRGIAVDVTVDGASAIDLHSPWTQLSTWVVGETSEPSSETQVPHRTAQNRPLSYCGAPASKRTTGAASGSIAAKPPW